MGFSVKSPGLQRFEQRKVDTAKAYVSATEDVAHKTIIPALETAARGAEASRDMRDDIGHYMVAGRPVVGIPAGGMSSKEARDLDYGTLDQSPTGWFRGTFSRDRIAFEDGFSRALSRRFFGGRS